MVLAEPVSGWRVGDRVIVTATTSKRVPDQGNIPSVRAKPETEERTIRAIDGTALTLDAPLAYTHTGARRVPRRGREPEPQCGRRIGRPSR